MVDSQQVCAGCGGPADRLVRRSWIRQVVRAALARQRVPRSEMLCDRCWHRERTTTVLALALALIVIAVVGSALALVL
ncbi:MAG: hypothetical protein ACF8R7_02410 [Phycisphaerales bacterium JB039]